MRLQSTNSRCTHNSCQSHRPQLSQSGSVMRMSQRHSHGRSATATSSHQRISHHGKDRMSMADTLTTSFQSTRSQSMGHQSTRHQSTRLQSQSTRHQSTRHQSTRLQSTRLQSTRLQSQSMRHQSTRLQSTRPLSMRLQSTKPQSQLSKSQSILQLRSNQSSRNQICTETHHSTSLMSS